jgi:predicted GIY-YIG superfamily endonuclease
MVGSRSLDSRGMGAGIQKWRGVSFVVGRHEMDCGIFTGLGAMSRRQLTFLSRNHPLGERFGREFFRQVPEHPGVYVMSGATEGVLYVGKARNLRQRLAAYRSASPERQSSKIRRLLSTVERIHWDLCDNEAAALDRERELIRLLKPRFNSVGVFSPAPQYVGWQFYDGFTFERGEALQNSPDQYGPFERLPVAFGVLLRLVWLTLHPGAGLHDVPSPLLRSQSPSWWRYDASADGSIPLFQGLLPELTLFFRGQSDVVIDRLASVVGNHPFEQQWRERDVETLRNFFTRSFGDE